MTLQEKFAALTPEQQEKFTDVKDEAGLDAYLAEIGAELTDEERAQALEQTASGLTVLQDEELDNVAGGLCKDKKGRPVVTLLTLCTHRIADVYYMYAREPQVHTISCGNAGVRTSKTGKEEDDCKHLSYEKGIWYCNYKK